MDLSVQIGSLKLANPLMAASGCYGYGVEYARRRRPLVARRGGLQGLFLKPREGHPPERIVETPSGMLNAIGLQGIGVHRYIAEKLPELRRLGATNRHQHLRQHAGRVRRAGANPVGRRGRARARAEHLLPEHQGRRHHLRLQPARHLRRRQRGEEGHAPAGHSQADAERDRRRVDRQGGRGRRRRCRLARQHVPGDGHRRRNPAAEALEHRRRTERSGDPADRRAHGVRVPARREDSGHRHGRHRHVRRTRSSS